MTTRDDNVENTHKLNGLHLSMQARLACRSLVERDLSTDDEPFFLLRTYHYLWNDTISSFPVYASVWHGVGALKSYLGEKVISDDIMNKLVDCERTW